MIKNYIVIILISLLVNTFVFSAGTNSDSTAKSNGREDEGYLKGKKNNNFKIGLNAIKKAKKYERKKKIEKSKEKFNEAIKYLTLAKKNFPNQPDILNYLGYSFSKVGDIQMAEIYYLQGLDINPNHISINEYLGELYVQTNRISMAKDRLKIVENCNCEEFEELSNAIKLGSAKY